MSTETLPLDRTGPRGAREEAPSPKARPSSPVRVAIVGAGFIADFHLEILAGTPGVVVVAVCDAALPRARVAARKFSVPEAVGSIAELARHDIHVAHVLVPPALHARVARELFEAGISVFIEKPLALASSEARALAELASGSGLTLGVNHNALHHPAFVALLARLRSGEIGRVEHVRASIAVPLRQLDAGDFAHWMFRDPRNIVFEQAPHPVAQVHAICGEVREAQTTLLSSRELQEGQTFHERWHVAAKAERASVDFHFAFGASFPESSIEVRGTDGSLRADLTHGLVSGERKTLFLDFWNSFLAGWRRGGALRRGALRGLFHYLRQTLGLGRREDAFFAGMRGSIQAFHQAFARGEDPPAGAEHGAAVLAWCEAIADPVAPARVEVRTPLPDPGPVREGEVVVLGGTGFIGRPTVRRLLERGHPVTCVVRREHGLPSEILRRAASGELRLVRGSLEDAQALREAFRGARCVVQLATGGGSSWETVERSMVQGTRDAGEACLAEEVSRFVFVSSTAALYMGPELAAQPMRDDAGPDAKPLERPIYARGKIAAEREVARLSSEDHLRATIVRPAVVLGAGTPFQHSGIGLWVRDNHCVGWGRGNTELPLVWVEDVAEAIARVVGHEGDDLDGKALNLSARTGLTARDVVLELRAATGRDLHFHPRAMASSQAMEIGKWLVKKVGGRKDAEFPSWRDLKSRSLATPLASDLARSVLGWEPVEEREAFLDRAIRVFGPKDT